MDPRQRLADPSLAAQPGPVAKESGDTKVEEIAGLHRKTIWSISRWFSAFSSLADLSLAARPGPVAKESGDTKVEELAGLHRETLRPVSR